MKDWRNCWQKNQKSQNELFNQITRVFTFEQRMSQKKNMNNVKEIIEKFLNKSSTKNDKCVNKR
jgi:mannitol/fructose-specific phosphotransferase system IIA component (Ntr-type)